MSELGIFSTFNNSELGCSITTLKVGDDIWLIGTEFATALEYANPQKAIRDHVDESDKFYFQDLYTGDWSPGSNPRGVNESFTPLKIQPHSVVISEAGALILRSKLPAAKEFTKWATKEVFPTLRKTGTYTIPEGALPKLKDINNNEIRELKGKEKKEFRYESKHKSELAKDLEKSQRGREGGFALQRKIRDVKTENERLKGENERLKEHQTELENQVEELTNELDAIKSGIAEILADDY